ncbi:MAG: hypothetical protein JW920_11010 [Deltaproteobacteria bacterium]|nr:hypothetical protein [Deltaproteobacteria bacterium]
MLAQDEPGEFDEVYEADGFRFVVNKDLVKIAGPFVIDHTFLGFMIYSDMISESFSGKGSCLL